MSYRDDLGALTARRDALKAEIVQKQRELDEMTRMLEDARRIDQAEQHFENAPAVRLRWHRRAVKATAAAFVASGVALGFAIAAPGPAANAVVYDFDETPLFTPEQVQRAEATAEALETIQLVSQSTKSKGRKRLAGTVYYNAPISPSYSHARAGADSPRSERVSVASKDKR